MEAAAAAAAQHLYHAHKPFELTSHTAADAVNSSIIQWKIYEAAAAAQPISC